MERELLKGNTPTMILAVLCQGPLHGYAIAREIERRSDNQLKFKEGTLYPALHALEYDGWIKGQWETTSQGRKRKVYTITQAGHAELKRRHHAWTEFANVMAQVIGGEPHGQQG
ncbi:MAG: PadR family transcriptional regulator [Abitibacteriaceae bacterium]|nr:PadR family transcriptional regulator [Abditibacteriaceae bacterium]